MNQRNTALLSATMSLLPLSAAAEGTLGTKRTGNIEIRYAPYKPDMDSQFALPAGCEDQGPYARFFGDEDDGLLLFGFQTHLIQKYGTLAAGGNIGYFNVSGQAQAGLPCRPVGGGIASSADLGTEESEVDESSLKIVPVQGEVSYRLTIWEDLVPLVPVLRAGLDYYMWRMGSTSGGLAKFESGQSASGGTWGWHYALGLHVLLDYFSQSMAADFDRDAGVNSTYLTFEYMHAQIDDFGSSTSLRLGDKTVVFGLGFDM